MIKRWLIPGGLLLAGACGILSPEEKCLLLLGPIIVVEVTDSISGLPTAEGATGFIEMGSFRADLLPNSSRLLQDLSGGRAGVYTVTVQKAGYRTWSRGGIRVEAGRCRPQTTNVRARLQLT